MPSSNQLIMSMNAGAVAEADRELSPLLKSFLAAVGHSSANEVSQGHEEDTDHRGDGPIVKVASVVVAMDDLNRSMLTSGQHQRYMQLLSTNNNNNSHGGNGRQPMEYRKLGAFVRAEQQLYCQAVLEYWETNQERLLLGFSHTSSQSAPATKFVQAATHVEWLQRKWREPLKYTNYGKLCQLISLETSAAQRTKAAWVMDAIQSKEEVVDSSDSATGSSSVTNFPAIGTMVPFCKPQESSTFLQEDEIALRIAEHNKVSIVATLEALETMLDTDGNNHWVLPVTFVNGVALVDSPLPHSYANPRACLTQGLNLGLAHWSELHGNDQTTLEKGPYRYVILSIPHVSGGALAGSNVKPTHLKL